MPDAKDFHEKPFLLVFVDAEDDARAPAYTVGTARWDGSRLSIDLGDDKPPFLISEEQRQTIRPLLPALEPIARGAKYFLTLSVGAIPSGIDPDQAGYLGTG
jgi:hypothetical protein